MMNEEFWRNATKVFCDNANIAFMKGAAGSTVLIAMSSGSNAQVFAFTPEHMKRFSQMVAHKVGEYEKQNGTIVTDDWTPDMKSPIQIKDIQKDD